MILATFQKQAGFDFEVGHYQIASVLSRELRDALLSKGEGGGFLFDLAAMATHVDPNARVVNTKDAVLFLAKSETI